MTPDDAKKRLQQLKAEATVRADKEKQYKAATANQYTHQMPSMDEWKAKHPDTAKAQGGTVNPFDYENPEHVHGVATHMAKHKDFSHIPDITKHLSEILSQGSYKHIEDPRFQQAIRKQGHDSYFLQGKEGKQAHRMVMHKATGGGVNPSIAQMKMYLAEGGQPDAPVDLFQQIYGRSGTPEEIAAMAGKSPEEERAILQQSIDAWNQSHPAAQPDVASLSNQPAVDTTTGGLPSAMQDTSMSHAQAVTTPSPDTPTITDEQRKFIDWQAKQNDPMQQGIIADQWARAGIVDPYSNATLIKNAQDAIDKANRRIQLTGGTDTAQWNDPNWEKYLGTNKEAYNVGTQVKNDPAFAAKFAKEHGYDSKTLNAWVTAATDPYTAALQSASTPSKFTVGGGGGPQTVDTSQIRRPGEAITAGEKYSQQYTPEQLTGISALWNQYSKDPATMSMALNQYGFTPDDLGLAMGMSKAQVQKYFSGQTVPTTGNQTTTKDLGGINSQLLNAQNAYDMLDTQTRNQLFSDWAKQHDVYGHSSPGLTDPTGKFSPWATNNPINVQQSQALDASYQKMIDDYNKAHPFTPFKLKPVGKARGGSVGYAMGGNVAPSIAQMRLALNQHNPVDFQGVGVNEAPNMSPKVYMPPDADEDNYPAPGGVATQSGMPIGGIDMSQQQGTQLTPQPLPQQADQSGQPPQGMPGAQGQPQMGEAPEDDSKPTPNGGNILQMTPQGQTLSALGGGQPKPPGMAKGGMAKKPLHYAPSPALMKAEIEAHAERMARQVAGLDNPNNKTIKQLAREQTLPVKITQGGKKQEVPVINFEEQKGGYSIGVPGDPSRGGLVPASKSQKRFKLEMPKAGEYLHSIGKEKMESPVPMYGGKDYGAYGHPEGWASDLGASAGMFNIVKRLHKEDPTRQIYGHYHKMSPESLNHAVHMMDAVLSHHQPHKADPERIQMLNDLMRNVATTTSKNDVPYPEFPGFENPQDVMFHGSLNSGMRKKMLGLLGKEKYFPGGKQKMEDIIFAMTHPELRNIETGAGGSSILKFDPTRELRQQISAHPTYGHDIPSKLIGRTRYITPAEILAPRSMHNAKQEIKAMGKAVIPFNQAKMNIIREPIDEQYINQMGEYENAMRKRLGYKKGGKVKLAPNQDTMRLELSRKK
jgi:hypothetical protein